jgi:hypothetical protein
MLQSIVQALAILLIGVFIAGCASVSDVLKEKDHGTVMSYSVRPEQAWEIAMTVLRWEGGETIEEHKSEQYMVTTVGMNFISYGAVVGVWVEPAGKASTKITVVTKRKVQASVTTGLTESTFHARFAQAVKIVKSGKKLPVEAPPGE